MYVKFTAVSNTPIGVSSLRKIGTYMSCLSKAMVKYCKTCMVIISNVPPVRTARHTLVKMIKSLLLICVSDV